MQDALRVSGGKEGAKRAERAGGHAVGEEGLVEVNAAQYSGSVSASWAANSLPRVTTRRGWQTSAKSDMWDLERKRSMITSHCWAVQCSSTMQRKNSRSVCSRRSRVTDAMPVEKRVAGSRLWPVRESRNCARASAEPVAGMNCEGMRGEGVPSGAVAVPAAA